jgi:rRNA maturation endonuclease Nob1
VDRIKGELSISIAAQPAKAQGAPKPAPANNTCPACGAKFDKPLKFCGECGKAMGASA